MTPQEKYGLIVIFSIISAVYIFAVGGFIRFLLEKIGVIKSKPSIWQIWFRRICFGLAIFGFGCFAYAYFIEPYW